MREGVRERGGRGHRKYVERRPPALTACLRRPAPPLQTFWSAIPAECWTFWTSMGGQQAQQDWR